MSSEREKDLKQALSELVQGKDIGENVVFILSTIAHAITNIFSSSSNE